MYSWSKTLSLPNARICVELLWWNLCVPHFCTTQKGSGWIESNKTANPTKTHTDISFWYSHSLFFATKACRSKVLFNDEKNRKIFFTPMSYVSNVIWAIFVWWYIFYYMLHIFIVNRPLVILPIWTISSHFELL